MSRPVSWLRSHPLSLRPYQRTHWSRLVGYFEAHLEGRPSALGYEAPMGSGKTTTVKATAAALLSEGKARLVVIAAPLDAIVQAWAVRGAWSHEPGGYLQLPSPPQDFGDLPRPTTTQLSDPRWWASATGCWVTTRQAMCTKAAREAMEKSRVSLRDVLAVGDEGHHHGDGTEAGKFFAALRARGAATLLVSGTPWHGSGSIFTSDTQVVRLSAAAYAQEIDPSTGYAYAPSQWRVERYIVPEYVTDDVDLAVEPAKDKAPAKRNRNFEQVMCRAVAERWAATGCPRTVINVPWAKGWKQTIVDELQRVAPAVLGRSAVVVNLIGDMTNEDRAAAQARLAIDGAAGMYDHPGRVDVVVSCARMDEGTDWPSCSHVFNIRIPSSPLRILQRWARASRGKRKIAGYPAAWVDTQTMVFFVPTLTGDDARERAYKQHREQAVLLAAYLADYEAASRWIDPRCFAAQDAAARRTEGRKLPKGARLAHVTNDATSDGDRRGGTAIERARATAEIVKRIQRRGPDGAVKIAELDAALAREMPDVSGPARKAALLSLYRTGEVADAVTAALGRANRATAEGKPALCVREELQAELDAIVEKFGHFDVSVPDELNVCAAKFTALEADDVAEYARQSGVPPWDRIRHDRAALEAFARGLVKESAPTRRQWPNLDTALRKLGSSLREACGKSAKTTADEWADIVCQFHKDRGFWPRSSSSDSYEAKLGTALSGTLRARNAELCRARGIPIKGDASSSMRRVRNAEQLELFEVIIFMAQHWRIVQRSMLNYKDLTMQRLNGLFVHSTAEPGRTRGIGYAIDRCQLESLHKINMEIEADCWRFVLQGQDKPDPRSWSDLLVSGDHKRIERAERVAFLDWKDTRLRGGTRWTDQRVGKGPKCLPAVRRPWTPPAPAEPADGT